MTHPFTVRRHPVQDTRHAPYDLATAATQVPQRVCLAGQFGPVQDQGTLGACTAFAATGLFSWLQSAQGQGWNQYSALAQYYWERALQGTISTDSGATIPQSVEVLEQRGAIPESAWPYDVARFGQAPPAAAGTTLDPSQVRLLGHRLTGADFVGALASGHPVLFGFTVYPDLPLGSYPGARLNWTGVQELPDATANAVLGGHAVVAVGYDLTLGSGYLLGRNQWSGSWALGGYWWMPLEFVSQCCFDGYCFVPPGTPRPTRFPVPDLTPRPDPPAHAPGTARDAPTVQYRGHVEAAQTVGGTVQPGDGLNVTAITTPALAPGWRLWFGLAFRGAPVDGLYGEPAWWWCECLSRDRQHWEATPLVPAWVPQGSYSFGVVRALPGDILPDSLGNPSGPGTGVGGLYPQAIVGTLPAFERGHYVPTVPPLAPQVLMLSSRTGAPGTIAQLQGFFAPGGAGTTVQFGDAVATVVAATDAGIAVRVPDGTGTVPVTVRDPSGTSRVGPVTHWTYTAPPPPGQDWTLWVRQGPGDALWRVQVGAYAVEQNAQGVADRLAALLTGAGQTVRREAT